MPILISAAVQTLCCASEIELVDLSRLCLVASNMAANNGAAPEKVTVSHICRFFPPADPHHRCRIHNSPATATTNAVAAHKLGVLRKRDDRQVDLAMNPHKKSARYHVDQGVKGRSRFQSPIYDATALSMAWPTYYRNELVRAAHELNRVTVLAARACRRRYHVEDQLQECLPVRWLPNRPLPVDIPMPKVSTRTIPLTHLLALNDLMTNIGPERLGVLPNSEEEMPSLGYLKTLFKYGWMGPTLRRTELVGPTMLDLGGARCGVYCQFDPDNDDDVDRDDTASWRHHRRPCDNFTSDKVRKWLDDLELDLASSPSVLSVGTWNHRSPDGQPARKALRNGSTCPDDVAATVPSEADEVDRSSAATTPVDDRSALAASTLALGLGSNNTGRGSLPANVNATNINAALRELDPDWSRSSSSSCAPTLR